MAIATLGVLVILACVYNFSILLFSKGLTNQRMFDADPLFNRDGCILVLVWGGSKQTTLWQFHAHPKVLRGYYSRVVALCLLGP